MIKHKHKNNKVIRKIPLPEHLDKYTDWLNKLDIKSFHIVNEFVAKEVVRLADDRNRELYKEMTDTLDRSILAALILETDMEIEDVEKVFELVYDLVEEDLKKSKKLKIKGNGDMAKGAEKYLDKLIERVETLLKEGVNQKESIEILSKEFGMLSKSMITNSYKRIRKDYKDSLSKTENVELVEKEAPTDKEIEQAIDYIFEEKKVCESKEKSKFEILTKKVEMTVKGEFGTYEIEDSIVRVNGLKFNKAEEVEEVFAAKIKELEKQKEELKEIYGMI